MFCFMFLNLQAQGIQFEQSKWQEALEKAKTENKLLFVDAYAKWCGPCKKMAKYEFVKEEVGDFYNTNFINLKLDMETPNGRTFDSKYSVSAFPTMFFLDGEGNIIRREKGGKNGDQLISMGEKALSLYDFSKDWKEKYDNGDRSYETVFNYIKALNKSKKSSLKISNEYLKSNNELTEEQYLMFLVEAASEADSKLFEELLNKKEKAIALVGEDKFNKRVEQACDCTVRKAVKYEFEILLDEALEKAQSSLTEGAKIYCLEARKKYALEMRIPEMYLQSVKSLGKEYQNDNPKIKKLVTEVMTGKVHTKEIDKVVVDLAKKYHKSEATPESTLLYVKALEEVDEFKKAVKVLEKSIDKLDEKDRKRKMLERMKENMEQKIS